MPESTENISFNMWIVTAKKYGRIVSVQFNVSGTVKTVLDETDTIFTLDEKYRPETNVHINYPAQNGSTMLISLLNNGEVQIYVAKTGTASGIIIRQCVTFISAS